LLENDLRLFQAAGSLNQCISAFRLHMFFHAFAASSALPEKLERGGTTSPLKIARQCQNVNPVGSGVNAVEDVHATQQ